MGTEQFPGSPYSRCIAWIYDILKGSFVFHSKSRQDPYQDASEHFFLVQALSPCACISALEINFL